MNPIYYMFIYVFFVGIIARNYSVSSYGKSLYYDSKITLLLAFVVVLLPVIMIGLRTNYVDTTVYLSGFKNIPFSLTEVIDKMDGTRGAGFLIYEWLIKHITSNANYFLLITTIIQMGAFVKLFYRYSSDYSYSMLLLFLSCYCCNMMNGIRQLLAVCLVIYFIDWAFEKKYIRFLIVVLLASTIHVAAILWIPIVFLVNGKVLGWRLILTTVFLVVVLMYLDRFTNILEESLTGTLYEGYTEQFTKDDGANIMHSVIAFIPVFLSIIELPYIRHARDHVLNFLVNLSVINLMINIIAHFTSGILIGRLPMFFNPMNYVLLPLLFDRFDQRSRVFLRNACMVGYLLYSVYYMRSIADQYISTILRIGV